MARPRKPYNELQFQRPNSRHRGRENTISLQQYVMQKRETEPEPWACLICEDDESQVYGWADDGVALCAECIRDLAEVAGLLPENPVQNEPA